MPILYKWIKSGILYPIYSELILIFKIFVELPPDYRVPIPRNFQKSAWTVFKIKKGN